MALKYCDVEVTLMAGGQEWKAEVADLGGIGCSGGRDRAVVLAQAMALRQLADRMESGPGPALTAVIFLGEGLPTIEELLEAEDAEDIAAVEASRAEMDRTGAKPRPWGEVKAELDQAD